MRFLIDANLPRSVLNICRDAGHDAVHVDEVFAPGTDDATIAAHARSHQLCLVTRDYDFADVRAYPPADYRGIVVIELPPTATAKVICDLFGAFLQQEKLVAQLESKLAIVEPGRVRIRA